MGVSGNYGQLDLIAALQWVQKNIAAFGGDPNKVAIYGQSGGGDKVNWLMCSPLAEGLFQRAICHSGVGGISYVPLEEATLVGIGYTVFAYWFLCLVSIPFAGWEILAYVRSHGDEETTSD